MALRKFAAFDVISSVLVPKDASVAEARAAVNEGASFYKTAHRAVFDYEPRPGYLYVRSRAISSRCNDNFDEFPADEIKAAYATFIGKPVFVNHHNSDHRRMRGVIIDAALHEDRNPDGSPDTWAEVLMEVHAEKFPRLAKAIIAKEIERTSMGTDVAYSICSACGNKATTPAEYCQHIPRMKGQRIYRTEASTGKKEGVLIREICHGLRFFENSLLVEDPADPTAFTFGLDTRGLGKAASLRAVLAEGDDVVGRIPLHPDAIREIQDAHSAGEMHREMQDHNDRRVVDLGDHNDVKAHLMEAHGWEPSDFWRNSHEEDHPRMDPGSDDDRPLRPHEIIGAHAHEHEVQFPDDYKGSVTLGNSHFHTASLGSMTLTAGERMRRFMGQPPLRGDKAYNMDHEQKSKGPADTTDSCPSCTHSMDRHHLGAGGHEMGCTACSCKRILTGPGANHTGRLYITSLTPMAPGGSAKQDPSDHLGRDTDSCTVCGSDIYRVNGSGWQHDIASGAGVPHMAQPGGLDKEAAGPKYPDPSQHPFFQTNPVHADHILKMWHAATDDEREQGHRWYSDAGLVAKGLGTLHKGTPHPMGATHLAAGLIANYSPQTNWATNQHNAARVLHSGKGLGGPGSGIFATRQQKSAADRMLGGEPHTSVLTTPKVSDFAHLVEHGGDKDRDNPHTVIDRHALSVAAGRRMSDEDYGKFPKSQQHYYHHVVQAYDHAAKVISDKTGRYTPGHAVQAATWLAQQRHNQAGEAQREQDHGDNMGRLDRGRARSRNNAEDAWKEFRQKHLPDMTADPGTGYSKDASMDRTAFGETKAPADVDTLRDEECPVCGDTDSYDGNKCQVCGFIAPPAMFQDPNLDLAKQLDLRKDNIEGATGLPGQPTEVPGETVPGSDEVPVDPSMLNDDGTVVPGEEQPMLDDNGQPIDPNQVVDPNALGPDGQPMLGPDGQPLDPNQVDMAAPGAHVNEGGEAFTPGPNVPGQPGDPEGPEDLATEQAEGVEPGEVPVSPDDLSADGEAPEADGQAPAERPGEGDPGTPDDGAPDLQCPACGFQADAAQPESTNMDDPGDNSAAEGSGGMMAGDVCPNCQQATLASVGEMDAPAPVA